MCAQDFDNIYDKIKKQAWSKDTLKLNNQWIHILSSNEIADIISLNAQTDNVKFDGCLFNAINSTPTVLNDLFSKISNELEQGSGVFVLKRFPINTLTKTTKDLYLKFCGFIGHLLPQNHLKELVIDIQNMNTNNKADTSLFRGPFTNDSLQFHSDRCDVTTLLCLQQAKIGGETLIASSHYIHNIIYEHSPELLKQLYLPYYYARAQWEKEIYDKKYYEMPVFSMYKDYFASRYMRPLINEAQQMDGVPKLTNIQNSALSLLEAIANDRNVHVRLRLEPGDILFFNNLTTFHARNAYEDNVEEISKRHLLRLWLSSFNNRPVSHYYKSLFGNIGAGELRGGYR